jgi:hypothetical protein
MIAESTLKTQRNVVAALRSGFRPARRPIDPIDHVPEHVMKRHPQDEELQRSDFAWDRSEERR